MIRPDITTVHMPMIRSEVLREGIDAQLSEAVAKEIESRTHLKLVSAQASDSVLTGKIISETKRITGEDAFDQPRTNEVRYVISFNWVDRYGNSIMQFSTIAIPGGMLNASQSANMVPEAGQSYASTQTMLVQRLAQQVVSQMELRW